MIFTKPTTPQPGGPSLLACFAAPFGISTPCVVVDQLLPRSIRGLTFGVGLVASVAGGAALLWRSLARPVCERPARIASVAASCVPMTGLLIFYSLFLIGGITGGFL